MQNIIGIVNGILIGGNPSGGSGVIPFSGLLDAYPGAAAAYSVRLLKSDYTGGLVEIRGENSATTTIATDTFYPDANNEFSLTSETAGGVSVSTWMSTNSIVNGFVRTWYDQSGNGNNATQLSPSIQPKIIVSGSLLLLNSMPVLDMSFGTSKLLVPSFAAAAPSIFTVSALKSGTSTGTIISGGDDTDNRFDFGVVSATNYRIFVSQSGSSTDISYSPTSYYNDNQYLFSTNPTQLRTDGVTVATGVISTGITAYTNDFRVGSRFFATGDVKSYIQTQELIFYPSNQLTNQSGIETNINNYYNIYSAPTGIGTFIIGSTFIVG